MTSVRRAASCRYLRKVVRRKTGSAPHGRSLIKYLFSVRRTEEFRINRASVLGSILRRSIAARCAPLWRFSMFYRRSVFYSVAVSSSCRQNLISPKWIHCSNRGYDMRAFDVWFIRDQIRGRRENVEVCRVRNFSDALTSGIEINWLSPSANKWPRPQLCCDYAIRDFMEN